MRSCPFAALAPKRWATARLCPCVTSDNARYGALGVIARVTGEAKPVLSAVEALGLQPDGDGWSRRAASFRGMAVHRLQPSAHVKCGITCSANRRIAGAISSYVRPPRPM